MPQKHTATTQTIETATDVAAIGKQRLDALLELQKSMFGMVEEMNRAWLNRTQTAANLASELASKIAESRSMPETSAACQTWANRRLELFFADSRRLLDDMQKIMEASARLLADNAATATSAATSMVRAGQADAEEARQQARAAAAE